MRLPLNIAIPCPPDAPLLAFDHGSGELVLVELQGHLELNDLDTEHEAGDTAAHTSSKAGQKVGKLDLSVPVGCSLLHSAETRSSVSENASRNSRGPPF